MINKNYMTPDGLSRLFRIPKTTIWKLIRAGAFRGVIKVGKHYRIPTQSVLDFEKRHCIAGYS